MILQQNLFSDEIEAQAIDRIVRFSKIADSLGLDICIGFSGGKDSQVVYHLMQRSGVPFKAYYNVAFESPTTKKFIRENYPDVIWRKDHHFGFIENIKKNHNGLLPTVQKAFCCQDYKHNPKYVDKCSVIGVRKAESKARSTRTSLSVKNKTELKKNKKLIDSYFVENCQSLGTKSIIQLLPIVDWTDKDVWNYIKKYQLPTNPEYLHSKRVGCMVCCKANFTSNYYYLMKYPKLVDSFILSCSQHKDWIITSENNDLKDDKVLYICRWLNHSFMPFSKKQQKLYEKFRKHYDEIKQKENK